jgi:hypothetical protein
MTLIDVAVSWAASKAGGFLGEQAVKGVLSIAMRSVARELAEQLGKELGEELGEQAVKGILKDVVGNVAERPIAQLVALAVEKVFGVAVDKLQEYGGSGDDVDRGIHGAVDGSPSGPTAPAPARSPSSPGDPLGGSPSGDPRVGTAD